MPNQDAREVVGLASRYEAGTLIEPHSHPAHQIAHATSGTMRVSVGNALWFVPPGRALWIPQGERHSIQCIGRVEMRTAYLSKAYGRVIHDAAVISVSPLMREILVRLAECSESPVAQELADILLFEVKQGAREKLHIPIPKNRRIARLVEQLQHVPADQTSLKTWAGELGFSERGLIRHIKSETGMNFRELRRLTRVMTGLEKLTAGASVTTAALDVGFETPSAFIHAFRIVTGKTPRQFLRDN